MYSFPYLFPIYKKILQGAKQEKQKKSRGGRWWDLIVLISPSSW